MAPALPTVNPTNTGRKPRTAITSFIPNISHAEPQRPQRALGVQRYGRHGGIGRLSGLRQAPSARLAPKNQGGSLRALPACAWHADRRLCVSNCNTWVHAISHQDDSQNENENRVGRPADALRKSSGSTGPGLDEDPLEDTSPHGKRAIPALPRPWLGRFGGLSRASFPSQWKEGCAFPSPPSTPLSFRPALAPGSHVASARGG